jgi:hypothetical protein
MVLTSNNHGRRLITEFRRVIARKYDSCVGLYVLRYNVWRPEAHQRACTRGNDACVDATCLLEVRAGPIKQRIVRYGFGRNESEWALPSACRRHRLLDIWKASLMWIDCW